MLRLANSKKILLLSIFFYMQGCSDSTSGEFGNFTTSTFDTEQNSLTVQSILVKNTSTSDPHTFHISLNTHLGSAQDMPAFSLVNGEDFPLSCVASDETQVTLASEGFCYLYIKSDAQIDVGEYATAALTLSDNEYDSVTYQLKAQNLLYVGGLYTYLNQDTNINIAYWNGSEWQQLGNVGSNSSESCNGANNDLGLLYSLVLDETTGHLFAAGCMSEIDDIPVNFIAQWNGESWNGLNSELPYEVRSLHWDSNTDALFVAGGTNALAGVDGAFGYLYQWQNDTWTDLGSGDDSPINAQVTSLSLDEDNAYLYLGGKFTGNIDSQSASRIALYDINNQAWFRLGDGVEDTVNGLFFNAYTDTLFVGGFFYPGITTWNNALASWTNIGVACRVGTPPCDGDSDSSDNANVVGYLAIDKYSMFIGGNFTSVANESDTNAEIDAEGLAQYNPIIDSWSSIDNSPPVESGFVKPLIYVANNNILYAAGSFTITENVDSPIYNIGKWDISSSEWQPLSSTEAGLDGSIETMVIVSKQAIPTLVDE
ncbi:hypothetical protein [uncultured Shewanella sp.]|uniref:hypothetical protein n=1 Tax=uncultured Shewanella sp. TaxID=173975 RepID=UPI00262BB677|nr:hypothetical protein [uncultured Shewanella sp.]